MRRILAASLQSTFLVAVVVGLVATRAHSQIESDSLPSESSSAVIQPAIDGILDAFQDYPLVGISDMHGLAQATEFYEALVDDPRFAAEVGNIVVEIGGAARQDVIDRFVNGEGVAYEELRQVWTDVVGWYPTVTAMGYPMFLSHIRGVNLGLPEEDRIRVWLGEPPIVWEVIESKDEYLAFLGARESHPAELISRTILKEGEKAIVIYGDSHLRLVTAEEVALWNEWDEVDPENSRTPAILNFRSPMRTLVEADYPGTFINFQVYTGFDDEGCTSSLDQQIEGWALPAIATNVRGSALERQIRECAPVELGFPPTMPESLRRLLRTQEIEYLYRDDAILFLAPAARLTRSPLIPDILLDTDYRREISRQVEIKTGQPLSPTWGRGMPVTPVPFEL